LPDSTLPKAARKSTGSHPSACRDRAKGEEMSGSDQGVDDQDGQRIDQIVDHPSFERIRTEILRNVEHRAQESSQAFYGLMTFCGIVYTGATVAVLGYMGGRAGLAIYWNGLASQIGAKRIHFPHGAK
jgi:hypothetical protein